MHMLKASVYSYAFYMVDKNNGDIIRSDSKKNNEIFFVEIKKNTIFAKLNIFK